MSQEQEPGPAPEANLTPERASPSDRPSQQVKATEPRASRRDYIFFATIASVVLVLDVGSKFWAETTLSKRSLVEPGVTVLKDSLSFVLAYNKGGAWGMGNGQPDWVRRPFFVLVSIVAVAFIVNLYRRLDGQQWLLRWGLPLVLGGALGNLVDRITRQGVVDFIDYRAGWVQSMNELVAHFFRGWVITDHWPTFNVADVGICVGVILMALDAIVWRRRPVAPHRTTSL